MVGEFFWLSLYISAENKVNNKVNKVNNKVNKVNNKVNNKA